MFRVLAAQETPSLRIPKTLSEWNFSGWKDNCSKGGLSPGGLAHLSTFQLFGDEAESGNSCHIFFWVSHQN